jgi:hypothetical protein
MGTVTIGDPEAILAARRERAGAAAGERGHDPGDIDWEDSARNSLGYVRPYTTDHAGGVLSGVRVADDIERDRETSAPGATTTASGQGFVEMADVEKVIYRGNRKLRYCYTQARLDDSTLQGIMWLTLTLATDGRIRGVVTEPRSSLKSEPLRDGGPVTFSYPFDFQETE